MMNRYTIAQYQDPGIREYRGNKFIEALPPIMARNEIGNALASTPSYDKSERDLPAHLRLHCLQKLFNYFEPLPIHLELEERFSILIRQGYLGRNPESADYIRHLRNGHTRVVERDLNAAHYKVQSTAASFSMIGISGAGKSTSIQNILKLYPQVIEHESPVNLTQVVWLKIDCPPDGSRRSLCINFFQQLDQLLGTNYESKYVGSRTSADALMGYIPMIANLHGLGVLIIDEIQNLSLAKSGGAESLLNFFVALVNTIGLPVILIGTPKALSILQGDFRHARRSAGVGSFTFDRFMQGKEWEFFLNGIWRYQWTKNPIPLTEEMSGVLYDETQGITDVLVKLYALVQHRSISSGLEKIPVKLIKQVAKERLGMIRPMIDALRTKEPKKIQKYMDLHIPSFGQMIATHSLPSQPTEIALPQEIELEKHQKVYAILVNSGADDNTAQFLIRTIVENNPGVDALTLIDQALLLLRNQQKPESNTDIKIETKARKKPLKVEIADDDMRQLVAAHDNAYAALLQAGLIKKPLTEFSILQ